MRTSKEILISLRKSKKHSKRSGKYWIKEKYQALIYNFSNGNRISNMALKFQSTEPVVVQGLKNVLYELLESSSLKAFRNGQIWRIPKQSIIAFICGKSHLNNESLWN